MKISTNEGTGLSKVIEPSLGSEEIYLSEAVLDFLKSRGMFTRLENLDFIISYDYETWEISDQPPTGTPGTIASVLAYIRGSFRRSNGNIICDCPCSSSPTTSIAD